MNCEFCILHYFSPVVQTLSKNENTGVEWIDLVFPTTEELAAVAEKYNLHPNLVQDCLEPNHLPKFEVIGKTTFIIIRVIDPTANEVADSIQEVTKKIAIFYLDNILITIHRREADFLFDVKDAHCPKDDLNIEKVLTEIIRKGIISYEIPIVRADASLDTFETKIFLKRKIPNMIRDSYYLKRKIDVYRRMLLLYKELLGTITEESNLKKPAVEDLKDTVGRVLFECEQVRENLNQLLNIHFNLSTQRVNEVILVLTLFSVFFMPLTFIVGVYGMNFKFMPEIDWKYGYLGVWILMAVIIIIIFQWFKRKKWL